MPCAAKANPALAEKLAPALKKISDAIDQLPLDKLPDSVRDGLAPIKGKLDDFARIGVHQVSTQVGRNQITWMQNANGDTIAARARLGEVFSGATRSSAEKAAQRSTGNAGLADDVGGHIIGHRFTKDQGAINMFPQNAQFNNSAFKTMENDWARWIEKGGTVEVDIRLIGNGKRPDQVDVRFKLIDSDGNSVGRFAKIFENTDGQFYPRQVN